MLYYNNNYALFIFEFQARIKKTTNSPLHFLNVGAVIVQNLEATYYLLAASGSEGAGGALLYRALLWWRLLGSAGNKKGPIRGLYVDDKPLFLVPSQ